MSLAGIRDGSKRLRDAYFLIASCCCVVGVFSLYFVMFWLLIIGFENIKWEIFDFFRFTEILIKTQSVLCNRQFPASYSTLVNTINKIKCMTFRRKRFSLITETTY